jgi:hypothetical protein
VRLQSLEVRRPEDFDMAFKAALAERAEGLIIVSSRLMSRQRQRIAEFAGKNRLIVAGGWGDWTGSCRPGHFVTHRVPSHSHRLTALERKRDRSSGGVVTTIADCVSGTQPGNDCVERTSVRRLGDEMVESSLPDLLR